MSHLPCYTIRIKNMRNKMKTYKIETEDRYGRFNEYDIRAESLELATLIAEKRVNLPNGAFVIDVKEVETKEEKPFSPREFWRGKEVVRDSDGSAVVGWYDDNDGNDIRCRD